MSDHRRRGSSLEALLGYAVTVATPFTYDLTPTVTLKELFVRRASRSRGIGEALFRAVASQALETGAGRLKWDVLAGNLRAESFYRALGGRRVRKWIPYVDGRPAGLAARCLRPASADCQWRPRAFARNFASSPRVTFWFGQKLPLPQPLVMPDLASASIARK